MTEPNLAWLTQCIRQSQERAGDLGPVLLIEREDGLQFMLPCKFVCSIPGLLAWFLPQVREVIEAEDAVLLLHAAAWPEG